MCKVSVIMSVYNCEKYVGKTIESIINQTFTDWEFIIINDASKDSSAEEIKKYKDERMIFIDNIENKGQCANLNYGISIAKGEYIAHTDHDDISYPTRLEKQVKYMDEHPEIVLLGTNLNYLKNGEVIENKIYPPSSPEELALSQTLINLYLPHSSFMMRASTLSKYNIKYEKFLFAEDYHMQMCLLKHGKIDFLHEPLIEYRIIPEQCTSTYSEDLKLKEVKELEEIYFNDIGFDDSDIILKAVLGGLETEQDYESFYGAFQKLATYYKIPSDIIKHGSDGINEIYRRVCLGQKRNLNNMRAYMESPYKIERWLESEGGQTYIKSCQEGEKVND